MAAPMTQLLGSGFGHSGSTSKSGPQVSPSACAAAERSSADWPTASAANSTTPARPVHSLRFRSSLIIGFL